MEGITPNYLKYNCQSHAIFYEAANNRVLIVRFLHQRMHFAPFISGERPRKAS